MIAMNYFDIINNNSLNTINTSSTNHQRNHNIIIISISTVGNVGIIIPGLRYLHGF